MDSLQQHRMIDADPSGFSVKFENRPGSYTPHHWHKAAELVLMIRGGVTCSFENGARQYKKGDLFLINSHEIHETRCTRLAQYLIVHIDTKMMCRYAPTFDHLFFSLTDESEQPEKAAALRELRGRMEQLYALIGNRTASSPFEEQACLFHITALLVRHFSHPLALEETSLRRSDMTRLEPLLEYIQLHHSEELPLDVAASVLGLNKEYFCRLFKKNMGITHLQYIYQVRTLAVCRDLENTDDPIGEIAERHGFRDGKTLNQYFKEFYGCTPSEKRKSFREILAEEPEQEEGEPPQAAAEQPGQGGN